MTTRSELNLIQSLDVCDVLETLGVYYKFVGSEIRMSCPFHKGKGLNFSINSNTKMFKCFSHNCEQEKHDFIDMVALLMSEQKREKVVEYLGETFKINQDDLIDAREITKSYNLKVNTLKKITMITTHKENETSTDKIVNQYDVSEGQYILYHTEECLNYLLIERGITEESIDKFSLGCKEGHITFPVFNLEGKLVSLGLRRLSPSGEKLNKYKFYGPRTQALYGLHEILKDEKLGSSDKLIIVEGVFDAIKLQQNGFAAVAIGSNRIGNGQLKILKSIEKDLEEIIICLDNDQGKDYNAGLEGTLSMINSFATMSFGLEKVSVIMMQPGKDPDEITKEEFNSLYNKRKSAIKYYLEHQIR